MNDQAAAIVVFLPHCEIKPPSKCFRCGAGTRFAYGRTIENAVLNWAKRWAIGASLLGPNAEVASRPSPLVIQYA